MTDPYFDASAIAPIFITEAHSDATERFLDRYEDAGIVVSDFAMGEFSSVCARHVRMGSLSTSAANAILGDGDVWRMQTRYIEMTPRDVSTAMALVRRFELGLRLPDAIHIAICQRLRTTLVTFDNRLAKAAKDVGLNVVSPDQEA